MVIDAMQPTASIPAGRHPSRLRSACALTAGLLLLSQPILAAEITVGGACTLADAITAANNDAATGGCSAGSGADEIRLTTDVILTQIDNTTAGVGGTSDGPNGLPEVITEIVLQGDGYTVRRGLGAPEFRLVKVAFPGDLTIRNTTLSNGGGPAFDYLGGAIANEFTAHVTLVNSTVSGSSAGGFYGGGGGIYNGGTATLTGTTISGNSAYIGGGMSNKGIADLTNSTLSGNVGGAQKGGAIDSSGVVTLIHSTVSGNSGGGAINVFSGKAYLEGTLLAASTGANCRVGSGAIEDEGDNLADDTSCGAIPATLTGLAASLEDNGGPTRTHALLDGSNAIGLAGSCGLATDQRGASRPADACDSGAYEFVPCPDLVLTGDTVVGTETRENCQRIFVGPDFAVAGFGQLTLSAGSAVTLRDGTSVETNGVLTVILDTDLQLTPP